jgi:hypothetical protein
MINFAEFSKKGYGSRKGCIANDDGHDERRELSFEFSTGIISVVSQKMKRWLLCQRINCDFIATVSESAVVAMMTKQRFHLYLTN